MADKCLHRKTFTRAQMHRNSIRLLIGDLNRSFEYVEPHEENLSVYSHRYFEIQLRSCTEFESLCKTILNRAEVHIGQKPSIRDYFQIRKIHDSLSEAGMIIKRWNPYPRSWFPFIDWTSQSDGPKWYQDYNSVKHSRLENFRNANLENAILGIAACVGLLCLEYGEDFLESTPYISAYGDERGTSWPKDTLEIGFAINAEQFIECKKQNEV